MAIYAYLSSIVRQLLSTLPDLFDCNDCNNNAETLKLALQLISANHYRRRFAFKHQIESTARFPRKRNLVMSVTLVFGFDFCIS